MDANSQDDIDAVELTYALSHHGKTIIETKKHLPTNKRVIIMMETETAAKVAAEALNGTTINSYHVDIHVREMKQLSVVVTASGHERQRKPCHGGLGGWVRDKLEDCLLLGPGWMKIG